MLEESHHLQLTKDSLRADQTLEHVRQLLQGHALPVAGVRDRPDNPEGSVPDGSIGLVVAIAGGCA